MSEQEINIAIAKACGWTEVTDNRKFHQCPTGFPPNSEGTLAYVSDYCGDLNAMHKAENRLTSFRRVKHGKILQDLLNEHAVGFVPSYDRDFASLSRIASATARQRAEAFLRTIGKWKEVE